MKRMSLISTLILLTLMVSYCNCQCESIAPSSSSSSSSRATTTTSKCKVHVSESIPLGMSYPSGPIFPSTIDHLLQMCNEARRSLDIASFYWTLQGSDVMPHPPDNSSVPGENLLNCYIDAAKNRGVKVRIAVSQSMGGSEVELSTDLQKLKLAGAEIRTVNFTKLVGAGVLHTKFAIGDNETFYIGSANMDWRSFTQVKEIGVFLSKCPLLAEDLAKVFQVYWTLGDVDSFIPSTWPLNFATKFNAKSPLEITLNGTSSQVYISSSPLPLNPVGRSNDIDAIVDTIDRAKKFINIAVMDYFPVYLFSRPSKFWPVIDDALKKAVIERGVKVRLLLSKWSHTRKSIFTFARSLDAYRTPLGWNWGKIEVKLFQVPATPEQAAIPFARVNHNKYMVTDEIAYLGTNNWSAGKNPSSRAT